MCELLLSVAILFLISGMSYTITGQNTVLVLGIIFVIRQQLLGHLVHALDYHSHHRILPKIDPATIIRLCKQQNKVGLNWAKLKLKVII